MYTEAWRRDWSRARRKVVPGDGAVWIWNLAGRHFPGAIRIVHLYRACQSIWELAAKLFPVDERARKRWAAVCIDTLDGDKIEGPVKILRSLRPGNGALASEVLSEAGYFERNAGRMHYPKFRGQGLPTSVRNAQVYSVASRRQRHFRLTLLPPQTTLRGLPGSPLTRRLIVHSSAAHPSQPS